MVYNTLLSVLVASEVGKTTVGSIASFKWCVENEGYEVGFYLPTYKQCKNVFKRMRKMLSAFGDLVSFNGSSYTITFWNGSFIQFLTADNDNMRSFTFDAIIVDEACFVKDEIWQEGIQATVNASLSKRDDNGIVGFKGKVLLTSTPKTKNWFYGMVKDDDERTRVTRFTSEEGGIIAKEILTKVKKQIPESIWRNEYMGEFLDAGNGLFKYLNCIMDSDTSNSLSKRGSVAALDIASKNDYTVLTIQNIAGDVIFMDRWRHQEYNIILDSVTSILKQYGSPICHVETNGVGQMPYEYLKKKYGKVKEWKTTNNKPDIIYKLQIDFNTADIRIPDLDYLKDELDNFTCEWKNGKAKFQGANGFHDDCVMSLAICNYNRSKVQTVSATLINNRRQRAL